MVTPRSNNISAAKQGAFAHWQDSKLISDIDARDISALVSASLVSFRFESFPAVDASALKAAVLLRGQRLFSALGAVSIDALMSEPIDNKVHVVLMALPSSVVDDIESAAQRKDKYVKHICVAEFMQTIPDGGLIECQGIGTLIKYDNGRVSELSVLGSLIHPQISSKIDRERLRIGVQETDVGGELCYQAHDFKHPSIESKPSIWADKRVRVVAMTAGILALLLFALLLHIYDVSTQVEEERERLKVLQPLAEQLQKRREELKATDAWFDERTRINPTLYAFAINLPDLTNKDQVYLNRLRQINKRQGVVEGIAYNRDALLAYMDRLRDEQLMEEVSLRSSRNIDKRSSTVGFEIVFTLKEHVLDIINLATKGADDEES